MFDFFSSFDDFAADLDVKEQSVDCDFITDFLMPYFSDLPRDQLAAKVAEVISEDLRKQPAQRQR